MNHLLIIWCEKDFDRCQYYSFGNNAEDDNLIWDITKYVRRRARQTALVLVHKTALMFEVQTSSKLKHSINLMKTIYHIN
jgi:hypothetical protein